MGARQLCNWGVMWFLPPWAVWLWPVSSLVSQLVKNPPAMPETCWIPGLGRSLGEGNSYLLQYSGLKNSMDCIFNLIITLRAKPYQIFNEKPFLVPSTLHTSSHLILIISTKQKLLAIITSILQIEKWRLREIKLCVQGCIHDKWQRRNVNEVYLTPEFLNTLPYFLQVIMYLSY